MNSTLVVLWFLSLGEGPVDTFSTLASCKEAAAYLTRTDPTPRDLVFNQPRIGKYICLPAGQHPYKVAGEKS